MDSRKLCILIIVNWIASALAETTINVSYEVTNIPELGDVYTCIVNDVHITEAEETIIISGAHTGGRTDSDVQAIKVISGVLEQFPNQFFSVYQNTRKLTISPNLGLRSIDQETFNGASNLRHVEITGNRITSLTDQTFSRSSRIESINLSNNLILIVAKNTFTGLLFLRQINLANNLITGIDSTLNSLLNLVELDLSDNRFAFITPLAFAGMLSLKTLRISNNNIFYIHPDTFSMVYSLETLVLDNNSIETVEAGLFGRNYALIHLSLKNTKINKIQSTFLETLLQINHIDLSENDCVDQVITVDLNRLEEVFEILAQCFANFDFDPNLTTLPPTDSSSSPTETSTFIIETTTSYGFINLPTILNCAIVISTAILLRINIL